MTSKLGIRKRRHCVNQHAFRADKIKVLEKSIMCHWVAAAVCSYVTFSLPKQLRKRRLVRGSESLHGRALTVGTWRPLQQTTCLAPCSSNLLGSLDALSLAAMHTRQNRCSQNRMFQNWQPMGTRCSTVGNDGCFSKRMLQEQPANKDDCSIFMLSDAIAHNSSAM